MQDFLAQVIAGIAAGGIYASLALALVLIYQAMGLINFAQGEFAMFTAFICFALLDAAQLPYAVAFIISVLVAFAGAFVIERVIVRPFERGSPLIVLIVTLALFEIVNSVAGFIWGYQPRSFPSPFPARSVNLGGILISIQNASIIAVSLVMLGLVYLLFNRTKLGLAMRATALYPEVSQLLGIRTGLMLGLGWGLASAVGAISGILVAPIVFLEPNMMQGVLIYAFAAAVLGGIDSPLGAVVGGLLLGIMLALIGAYIPALADLRLALSLMLIVVLLLVRPTGLFGQQHARRV
ncbi:MAG: branched-chain amino acid ABC transporter permease [Chloroflexi bacterium]|nr:branched-chain amino acid ABC transporter permease [Chloroflexota bacterium]MBV9601084.1 branched-chain amino acid ABC transporter permease [Chloroflexota bacterium]